jgi:DNA helicase HerA-like ATPase
MNARSIGYVVGEVDTQTFTFVSDRESFPPRHEYLVIPEVEEKWGEGLKRIDVLAQVTRIANYSDVIGEDLSLRELQVLISRYGPSPKVFGTAKVLGYLDGGEVRYPRSAAVPGQEVYVAPDDLLEGFFTKDINYGIDIGTLITRERVRVRLDPNGFRRHVAVIAQTGAGKSYLVGLILEKLLPMGATIIVFDPNSDYVMMRWNGRGKRMESADSIKVYRPPGVRGRRYTDDEIGGTTEYTIDFGSLTSDEVSEVAGIPEKWSVIRDAINRAIRRLEGFYGPEQLVTELETLTEDPDRRLGGGAERALTYIRRLADYRIWGNKDIPLGDLLKPNTMSVIDLAGLQRNVSEYIVEKTLSEIWNKAVTGDQEYPVFTVIEEAHNFAPQGFGRRVTHTIDRIASEGRKFRIFLLVVTQRPKKISENVLSQCNSQIIMRLTNPEDMSAVRTSSERLSEDLFNDLPGLNKGEAIIVGELTKVPAMVKVSGRASGEGGSDVNVYEELKRARETHLSGIDESLVRQEDLREKGIKKRW